MDRTEMTPLEAARKRPGMYIGSVDSRGLYVLLRNLIEKACDACLESTGGMIAVDVLHDGGLRVNCNAILSPFSSTSDLSQCLQDACSGAIPSRASMACGSSMRSHGR